MTNWSPRQSEVCEANRVGAEQGGGWRQCWCPDAGSRAAHGQGGAVGLKTSCQVVRGRQIETRTFGFCASVLDASLTGSWEGMQGHMALFTDAREFSKHSIVAGEQ